MLHIFVSSSKGRKFSEDQLHGIIKWVSSLNMKTLREEKEKINEEVKKEKSERIRKFWFLSLYKLDVHNLL